MDTVAPSNKQGGHLLKHVRVPKQAFGLHQSLVAFLSLARAEEHFPRGKGALEGLVEEVLKLF